MTFDKDTLRTGEDALASLFKSFYGHEPESMTPLSTSGSNRRYFRMTDGHGSYIGCAGTDRNENAAFVALDRHFRGKGVNVPEVFAVSQDGMSYIQEDLGDISLFDAVSSGRAAGEYSEDEESLLTEAVSALPEIQYAGAEGLDFNLCYPEPAFGRRLVMSDLNYFKFCFLKPSGIGYNESALDRDFGLFASDLMSEDFRQFMYRDFQARNVMLKDGVPYFIDFQGGRKGPVYYDVASFVWQAKAGYPERLKDRLIDAWLDAAGEYARIDRDLFKERLRLFVLFRTLQVLGAYGFRGNFERKQHFLQSIPYAMANLRRLLEEPPAGYAYLVPLLRDLSSLPQYQGQQAPAGTESSDGHESHRLHVLVCSFSYKKGLPDDPSGNGGGYVFDCRALPNPGKYEYYRQYNGMDAEVIDFFADKEEVPVFLGHVWGLADAHVERFMQRGFTHMMICFGCTGGQHRSVYCAERTAAHIASAFDVRVTVVHREQGVTREL